MHLILRAFKHRRLSCVKLQTTGYVHLKPEKKRRKGFLPFFLYLWVADVGVFIHKHCMKLFILLVDLDIIKETHSCESGKSSRLGMRRKHQAVYFDSQIITSIGDILASMFSSQWRFFSSTSFSS